jgi:outer membrane protein assembly factor BamB
MMACRNVVRVLGVIVSMTVVVCVVPERAWGQWPQWGGPNRNFMVESEGLANEWPKEGPPKVWERELGSGYSSIVVDDGMLYTMCRDSNTDADERTVALDTQTGKTIWESRHPAPLPKSANDSQRKFTGPNATPLVVGNRLFTIGRNAVMRCYQKADGTILWEHDLPAKFGAEVPDYGFSCSPIAYGSTVIVPIGRTESDKREGRSLIAFAQSSGDVVWHRQTFRIGHASPILINFAGEDQLVLRVQGGIIGLNPANGGLLWEHRFPAEVADAGTATPVFNGKDTLLCTLRDTGRAIRLTRSEGRTSTKELWSTKKAPFGMGTPIIIDNLAVGPKSGSMDAPLLGVSVKSGKRLWLKRGFPAATCIHADGKLIVLDHDGQLGLGKVTRKRLKIQSRCQVMERESFTVPTLAGTTLYVRDEKRIMALDLGVSTGS